MIQTRSQQQMKLALELVQCVENQSESVRTIYGGLCHNFPILVRTCGLCQAVAFSVDRAGALGSESKDDSDRATAHKVHLEHVAKVLGIPKDELLERLIEAPVDEYIRYTRDTLSAWVYFKRFARSILKVEPGGDNL